MQLTIRHWMWAASLGAIALGITWCHYPRQPGPTASPLPPLAQDPAVQVYFNHNRQAAYTEPYRPQYRPGDDLEAIIIAQIDRAQGAIDLAVQELRLPRVAQALARKQRAGVQVRLILENTYHHSFRSPTEVASLPPRELARYREWVKLVDSDRDGNLSAEELGQRDALTILANAGVKILDDRANGSRGSGLMHHKFMVVDGQRTVVTSANWTLSDIHGDLSQLQSRGNANNLLVIDHPQVAAAFNQEFALMWGDGPGGATDSLFKLQKTPRPPLTLAVGQGAITLQFAPVSRQTAWLNSPNGLIGQTLNQSQTSAHLALFVFADRPLGEALSTLPQRGVKLQALVERDFAYRPYSQMWPMAGVVSCRGRQQTPWSQPAQRVGVPQLAEGDRLHHKFAVIDRHTVITGSHNWSAAANHHNDEAVLVIRNPLVAAHFEREFDHLAQTAKWGMPQGECGVDRPGITEGID